MKYFQVLFGYLVVYSLLFVFTANILSIFLFVIIIGFITVIPHPYSRLNPFAFGLRLRKKREEDQS